MRHALTAQQSKVLAFIQDFAAANGSAPTRAEIARNFGWASANAAETHVAALARKGYVELPAGNYRIARGIRVVGSAPVQVPAVDGPVYCLGRTNMTGSAFVCTERENCGRHMALRRTLDCRALQVVWWVCKTDQNEARTPAFPA